MSDKVVTDRLFNWLLLHKNICILSVSSLLAFSCIGIVAYLTAADFAENELTVGYVNAGTVETFYPPQKLEPGVRFEKKVTIKNQGLCDCYVRVKVVFSDSDMQEACILDYNTDDYVYDAEDGYWYYKEILEVNESSESLFSVIQVKENVEPATIKDFDIQIYEEAYQAEGFSNYKKAWDFFKKNR